MCKCVCLCVLVHLGGPLMSLDVLWRHGQLLPNVTGHSLMAHFQLDEDVCLVRPRCKANLMLVKAGQ